MSDRLALINVLVENTRDKKVLTIGENHEEESARRFLSLAVPRLANCGFTVLALELPIKSQDLLSDFESGKTDMKQFATALRRFDLSFPYLPDGTPDSFYFAAIEAARQAKMKLIAVDDNWGGKGSIDRDRDEYMTDQILPVVRNNERVVLFGGLCHQYVREEDNRGEFLTVNELLRPQIDGEIYSVLIKEDRDKEPVLIDTSTDELGEQTCLVEGRCKFGPCTITFPVERPCPYCAAVDRLYTVRYRAFDAIIRLPPMGSEWYWIDHHQP